MKIDTHIAAWSGPSQGHEITSSASVSTQRHRRTQRPGDILISQLLSFQNSMSTEIESERELSLSLSLFFLICMRYGAKIIAATLETIYKDGEEEEEDEEQSRVDE